MSKQELLKKLAGLESVHDQLISEISYVDHLMRLIGFPGGISALKETAQEYQEKGDEYLEGRS